ncbi:MAG: SH3 domain-containing protein, partial [Chloroflexota bacterium]
MLRRLSLLLLIITIYSVVIMTATAQNDEDTCSSITTAALEATRNSCAAMNNNHACYGNSFILTLTRDETVAEDFVTPGDQIALQRVDSFQLSALDPVENVWGVAQIRALVTRSDSSLGNAELLLFGDVRVGNEVDNRERLMAVVSSDIDGINVNLRLRPEADSFVLGTVEPRQDVTAVGRLADNSWLRLLDTDKNIVGWAEASLIEVDGDIETLTADDTLSDYYGAMQVISLENGGNTVDGGDCSRVNQSGLLIQTPQGPATVRFDINEVTVDILPSGEDSTVLIETQPDGLGISVFGGAAYVEGNAGGGYVVAEGATVSVSDSAGGVVTSPVPYDPTTVGAIWGETGTVSVAEPATDSEITVTSDIFTGNDDVEEEQSVDTVDTSSDADTPFGFLAVDDGGDGSGAGAPPDNDDDDDDDGGRNRGNTSRGNGNTTGGGETTGSDTQGAFTTTASDTDGKADGDNAPGDDTTGGNTTGGQTTTTNGAPTTTTTTTGGDVTTTTTGAPTTTTTTTTTDGGGTGGVNGGDNGGDVDGGGVNGGGVNGGDVDGGGVNGGGVNGGG